MVFVLSPSSARSEICAWEVEEAERLNKRILPVICRALEGASPPQCLRDLNYIFLYEEPKVSGSGFGTGLASLVAALNTDFDWLREHTRYLQRAMEWDKGGRPANRLLSGNDIAEGKAWAARRSKSAPEPTALHLDFIHASEEEAEARLSEQRKQFEAVAAAQAEREMALHDREEALRQRWRVARVRNIALVVVSILAVVAVLFGWFALQARTTAERQQAIAEEQRATAGHERTTAGEQRAIIDQLQRTIGSKLEELEELRRRESPAEVQRVLGLAYANGYGVAQNYIMARMWFQIAANKGDAAAMLYLGALYDDGYGLAQNFDKARKWYESAAAKGDALAMAFLEKLPIRNAILGRYFDSLQAGGWNFTLSPARRRRKC